VPSYLITSCGINRYVGIVPIYTEYNLSTPYIMPQDIVQQSVLQRHLRALIYRTTDRSNVSTSAVHPKPRKRSFSQVRHETDKDIDTFKGRLLGVEDGLIDAIKSEACPDPPAGRQTREYSTSSPWYSQAKAGTRGRRLLGSGEGLDDTLTLPAERYEHFSIGPECSGALGLHPPLPHPIIKDGRRCSIVDDNTAAHHIWCTCAVTSYCFSTSGDDSDSDGACADRA
jgi:hypothetical protein